MAISFPRGISRSASRRLCTRHPRIEMKALLNELAGAVVEENANKLNVVAIANNDTHGVQDAGGAVVPSEQTVADNSYAPLSRAIYMNVNNANWDLVRGFFEYGYSEEGMEHVSDVGYVALPDDMIEDMLARLG